MAMTQEQRREYEKTRYQNLKALFLAGKEVPQSFANKMGSAALKIRERVLKKREATRKQVATIRKNYAEGKEIPAWGLRLIPTGFGRGRPRIGEERNPKSPGAQMRAEWRAKNLSHAREYGRNYLTTYRQANLERIRQQDRESAARRRERLKAQKAATANVVDFYTK